MIAHLEAGSMEYQKNYKPLVLVGAAALCWSVWFCRNTVVFKNKHSSFLQVIYSTTHWLRTWAILQQPAFQEVLVVASQFLKRVAKGFFLPGHMNDGLVLGLTVISIPFCVSDYFRLCAILA